MVACLVVKVLVLSSYGSSVVSSVERCGDEVLVFDEKINPEYIKSNNVGYIVSFGYRYIITPQTLEAVKGLAINLHISYLPYNKGAHPNLWSNADGTPSGVTIHKVDKGLDTGNILFQKEVPINQSVHTFSSSYKLLVGEIERLFDLNWCYLRTGECSGWRQQGQGTFHYAKEADALMPCLPSGWDTNISEFKRRYLEMLAAD